METGREGEHVVADGYCFSVINDVTSVFVRWSLFKRCSVAGGRLEAECCAVKM